MSEDNDASQEAGQKAAGSPLIFISHDGRDAELADAFSKLLKSVSAGMLKSFRSSDKTGTEGIEFGDEWYKRLMSKLDAASDVVCLLTERSLNRPWILYEAGVAKGKLGTPVHGVALGIALSRVSAGPFYQFQNSDDDEGSLTKLVLQLCKRVSGLEPDEDVVRAQVQVFRERINGLTKANRNAKKGDDEREMEEGAVAKVLEEMKVMVRELPLRIEDRVGIGAELYRPRRFRRIHPMMLDEMAHALSHRIGEPVGLLIIASLVREDFPWLYELGVEAYRTVKTGNAREISESIRTFRDASEFAVRGPFMEAVGPIDKEMREMLRDLPRVIDSYLDRLGKRTANRKLRSSPPEP